MHTNEEGKNDFLSSFQEKIAWLEICWLQVEHFFRESATSDWNTRCSTTILLSFSDQWGFSEPSLQRLKCKHYCSSLSIIEAEKKLYKKKRETIDISKALLLSKTTTVQQQLRAFPKLAIISAYLKESCIIQNMQLIKHKKLHPIFKNCRSQWLKN